MAGKVRAVCISKVKGTEKHAIEQGEFVVEHGILGDAHAGNWHRQVSLLSANEFDAFQEKAGPLEMGAFGENLLVEDIDFKNLPVGTILKCNDVVLQMTQIGKDCHSHCTIFHRVGDCIMPRCGVFAKVIHEGTIQAGDMMSVIGMTKKKSAAVITLSDKGSIGQREDTSGKRICEILEDYDFDVVEYMVLPDEPKLLERHLKRLADQRQVHLILTTGGTGFSLRDNTPEATMNVMTRNAPGIAEAIRYESMKYTKRAMLSRGASVIRNKSLIVNLPGSLKAVNESMEIIMDSVLHGIDILNAFDSECGEVK